MLAMLASHGRLLSALRQKVNSHKHDQSLMYTPGVPTNANGCTVMFLQNHCDCPLVTAGDLQRYALGPALLREILAGGTARAGHIKFCLCSVFFLSASWLLSNLRRPQDEGLWFPPFSSAADKNLPPKRWNFTVDDYDMQSIVDMLRKLHFYACIESINMGNKGQLDTTCVFFSVELDMGNAGIGCASAPASSFLSCVDWMLALDNVQTIVERVDTLCRGESVVNFHVHSVLNRCTLPRPQVDRLFFNSMLQTLMRRVLEVDIDRLMRKLQTSGDDTLSRRVLEFEIDRWMRKLHLAYEFWVRSYGGLGSFWTVNPYDNFTSTTSAVTDTVVHVQTVGTIIDPNNDYYSVRTMNPVQRMEVYQLMGITFGEKPPVASADDSTNYNSAPVESSLAYVTLAAQGHALQCIMNAACAQNEIVQACLRTSDPPHIRFFDDFLKEDVTLTTALGHLEMLCEQAQVAFDTMFDQVVLLDICVGGDTKYKVVNSKIEEWFKFLDPAKFNDMFRACTLTS